jgi:hypothetical protein
MISLLISPARVANLPEVVSNFARHSSIRKPKYGYARWDEDQTCKRYQLQRSYRRTPHNAHERHSSAAEVIEETLKGKELNINSRSSVWYDKDVMPATANRIKWWVQNSGASHRAVVQLSVRK